MKLVSLWHIARVPAIQTVAQRLNECYPLSPTLPHSLSLTATPRSTLPSSSPFLVCPSHRRRSPLARSRSSRPATAHALLLIVVSPASCCFYICLCLSSCVRALMQYNNPALLVAALPAVVGSPATRTAERLPGVDLPNSSTCPCMCLYRFVCDSLTHHQRQQSEGTQ